MGINCKLEDENGNAISEIFDSRNEISRIMQKWASSNTKCIKYIDLYGNTTFNRLQMEDLISDFEIILKSIKIAYENDVISQMIKLAKKCKNEVHTYLKYYGD